MRRWTSREEFVNETAADGKPKTTIRIVSRRAMEMLALKLGGCCKVPVCACHNDIGCGGHIRGVLRRGHEIAEALSGSGTQVLTSYSNHSVSNVR
jgi:hypothetical protein